MGGWNIGGDDGGGYDPWQGEVRKAKRIAQDHKDNPGRVDKHAATYWDAEAERNRGLMGMDTSKQEKELEKSKKIRERQYADTQGVLGTMAGYDQTYDKQADQYTGSYLRKVNALEDEANDQAKSAQRTYSNNIQPRFKGIMEQAGRDARHAMSLKEAGNPNNSVHRAVRGMYDQQAQNVGRQGLADVGVLNAMGAQATAQQMGVGGPMTNAQMQLMQANNMQQSGAAYARAQQQMDRLREQGIERGFQESDAQYARGQMAKDRYERSIGNYEGAMDRNIDRQRGFRGERQALGADIFGTSLGRARDRRDTHMGISQRQLGAMNNYYAGQQEGVAQKIALQNANNAAQAQIIGGVLGAGGTAAGAYYGGAGGAQQGGQAGRNIGGAGAQAQAPTPSYQYNYQQPATYQGPQQAGQNQPGYYRYT